MHILQLTVVLLKGRESIGRGKERADQLLLHSVPAEYYLYIHTYIHVPVFAACRKRSPTIQIQVNWIAGPPSTIISYQRTFSTELNPHIWQQAVLPVDRSNHLHTKCYIQWWTPCYFKSRHQNQWFYANDNHVSSTFKNTENLVTCTSTTTQISPVSTNTVLQQDPFMLYNELQGKDTKRV